MRTNTITVHSPECQRKIDLNHGCCHGNLVLFDKETPGRIIKIAVFPFDALSEEAKRTVLDREREIRLPDVREMVEAFVKQKLGPQMELRRLRVSPKTHHVTELIIVGAPPECCQELSDVVCHEVPLALSDEKMIEHIKADSLEFLADGTLWVYRDKERPPEFFNTQLGEPYQENEKDLSPEQKEEIDKMELVEMARIWRFSDCGHPLLQGNNGGYFFKVMKEKGGITPEISKQIGWDKP